jgi:hypothetical protein
MWGAAACAVTALHPLQNFAIETKRLPGGRGDSKTQSIC